MRIITIILTLMALWNVRSMAGRRSLIREQFTTTGTILITMGLICKSFILELGAHQWLAPIYAYPILGAGYILLMYGFVGWDRMTLQRPSWPKALGVIAVIELGMGAIAYLGNSWWHYLSVGVVVMCVMLMDLLLLGYALRQRFYMASPFVILHMAASCITVLIDLNGHRDPQITQGIMLTATTSALLFYINTRLIIQHTFRGRMQIV